LPEERSELLDSAEFLNNKMREIRDGGNIVGLDRIAVVAALNKAMSVARSGKCASASRPCSRRANSSICDVVICTRALTEGVARCRECERAETFSIARRYHPDQRTKSSAPR
jgi:cell division protein ZapA (FtsZ GTPase activity inhibitor)